MTFPTTGMPMAVDGGFFTIAGSPLAPSMVVELLGFVAAGLVVKSPGLLRAISQVQTSDCDKYASTPSSYSTW
jgi:hypothetical protein